MDMTFVDALMHSIIEFTMIPKVQVERVVGPILSIFIEDVLTATFQYDSDFSGVIKMISPEFPLKKEINNKSTNLDWLMYNIDRDQLLLVELKTSDSSINLDQLEIYKSVQETVQKIGGSFLLEDLEIIRGSSGESGKYQYMIENKVSSFRNKISNCRSALIIYIVPQSMEYKIRDRADKVLTFGMLSSSVSGVFAKEWQVIHEHLCKLDTLSKKSRNSGISKSRPCSNRTNSSQSKRWQGTLKFDGMVDLCLKHGNDIIIGFTGGKDEFTRCKLTDLKNRSHYKWDYAKNMGGKKYSDWLAGSTVIEILKQNHKYYR